MKKMCPKIWNLWSYNPDLQRVDFTDTTLKRVDIQPFYRHVILKGSHKGGKTEANISQENVRDISDFFVRT